jgi:hypothetical protein
VRRFSKGFQFTAAYTYSKARDDKPDQTSVVVGADDSKVVQNALDKRADFAAADTDLRHRFVFSPVYELGRFTRSETKSCARFSAITLSPASCNFNPASLTPPSSAAIRTTTAIAPMTVFPARHATVSTRHPFTNSTRASRAIRITEGTRLRLILEGFNIFNRSNVVGVNNTFYNFATGTGGVFTLTAPSAATAFGTSRTFSTQSPFLSPRQLQLAVKFDF